MMTISQIYNLAIKKGVDADPRPNRLVNHILQRDREKFARLTDEEKKFFDLEELTNPYSDTRILFGDPATKVNRIMVGIDIEAEELLIAKELSKIDKIDLVISHHPMGKALAGLNEVMRLQADLLSQYGVPINIAEGLLEKRMGEVHRSLSPRNHAKTVDAAKLLNQPLMCIHTPADNMVFNFLKKEIGRTDKFETVGELIKHLKSIPEYEQAIREKSGPAIVAGSAYRRPGKIALAAMTGGTEGAKEIYEKMSQAGIGTIIAMHMQEEHKIEAERFHLNVVVAGHMASDSLGLNLLLDELEKKGIEIIPCSGFIRVSRVKKAKIARPKKKKSRR